MLLEPVLFSEEQPKHKMIMEIVKKSLMVDFC